MTYAPVSPPAGLLIGSRRLCPAVVSLLFFVLFLVVGGLFLRPFFLTWTVADGPQKRRLAIAFTALDRRVFGTFLLSVAIPFFFQECVSEQISFEELMDGFHVHWMSENLSRESQRTPPPLVFGQSTFTGFYQLLLDATRFYRV